MTKNGLVYIMMIYSLCNFNVLNATTITNISSLFPNNQQNLDMLLNETISYEPNQVRLGEEHNIFIREKEGQKIQEHYKNGNNIELNRKKIILSEYYNQSIKDRNIQTKATRIMADTINDHIDNDSIQIKQYDLNAYYINNQLR